jgi:ATP-dependent Clp protease ATP-binding subunit ClpA
VSGQRICRLAETAADAADPEVALRTLTELRREVDEFERQQVARALTAGRRFKAIAGALGVSRQAVHRRFRDLARHRRMSGMPPTPELRLAIEYARTEADGLGAPALTSPHLLLGILRSGDRRAAAALASAGAELPEMRRAARAEAAGDGAGLRGLLAGSVKRARAQGDEEIRVEHVLRAALADDRAIGELLSRVGVAPSRVLDALGAMPADDAGCREA